MRIAVALTLIAISSAPLCAPIDGNFDPTYGDAGRRLYGFLESSTPTLQAMVKSASNGKTWMFANDPGDRAAIYITRTLANGQPDTGFGPPLNNGQRRIVLPAALIAQQEALDLDGALLQADGKPLIFGGLRAVDGEAGPFPGLICRLTVAGTLDLSFDGDGCKTFRSFLQATEACHATDAALSAVDQSVTVIGNCTAETLTERPFVTRILSSGATDLEFGAGAGLITPSLPLGVLAQHYEALVLRPNGFTAVLGTFEAVSNNISDLELGVIQFDGGGSLDLSFGNNALRVISFDRGGNNHDRARDLVLKADGRLIALGEAQLTNPDRTLALLGQLTESGSLDSTFGTAGKRVDELNGALNAQSAVLTLALDEYARLLVTAQRAVGQPQASVDVGQEFWFALPPSVPPDNTTRVIIVAEVATSGTLSSPSLNQTYPFTALPGAPAVLQLPGSLHSIFDIQNNSITNRTIRVVANAPVSVVPLHGRNTSVDSALITPINQLGTEYRVMSWGPGLGIGSQLVVVGTVAQTVVRITPKVAAGPRPAGVPFQITLNQGEAFHLRAGNDEDLTGSLVSANKPVAVFSGNSCALVPDASFDFCDLAYEQQRPLSQWGTSFVMAPHPSRPNGDVIRILAHEPNTSVYENGTRLATLMPGEQHTILRSSATVLTTTKPASVAQFGRGCKADLNPLCIGDPFQLTLEPTSRWSSRVLLGHHDNGDPNSEQPPLMTIVMPAAATASVRVNGTPVPVAAILPIGTSGYHYAQLNRTALTSDLITADAPIFVTSVGLAGAGAHGHAAAVLQTGDAANPIASADDVLLRLRPNGSRDVGFGVRGLKRIDHTDYFQATLKSTDRPVQMLADGSGILVGSATRNGDSEQDLLLTYRVISDGLFADDLEVND